MEEAVETIAKFFNDLIGALVPGAVLAIGLTFMHLGPVQLQSIFKLLDSSAAVLTVAGLLFALGHVLLAVHEHSLKKLLMGVGISKKFDEAEAKKKETYVWFAKLVSTMQADSCSKDWSYNELRSVALSVSSEAGAIGRRFMFISLLCSGVGVALLIIAFDFAICHLADPTLLHLYKNAAPFCVQVSLFFGVAWTLFKQGEVFYSRAMVTPFSIAVAELKFKKDADEYKSTS